MISDDFVIDDGLRVLVPQHRNSRTAVIVRIGTGIELMQVPAVEQRIGYHPLALRKRPALLCHQPMRHRHRHDLFQTLQRPHDQRAMRPRTGQRHIQVIAPGRGREPVMPGRPGTPGRRHPIAERRVRALEPAGGGASFGRIRFLFVPDAVDQQPHLVPRRVAAQAVSRPPSGAPASVSAPAPANSARRGRTISHGRRSRLPTYASSPRQSCESREPPARNCRDRQ